MSIKFNPWEIAIIVLIIILFSGARLMGAQFPSANGVSFIEADPAGVGVITADVNARPCPYLSNSCRPATVIQEGEEVLVYGVSGGQNFQNLGVWYIVFFQDKQYFVHGAFIDVELQTQRTEPYYTPTPELFPVPIIAPGQ